MNASRHEPGLPSAADPGEGLSRERQGRADRPRDARPLADRAADAPVRRAPVAEPVPASAAGPDPLHDALATLAIGLAVVDPGWTLTYANDALALLVGQDTAALVGRPLAEIFPALRGAQSK